MRRWAFNLFCAVSLLVFAASVTLWVRSYFVSECIALRVPRTFKIPQSELLDQPIILGDTCPCGVEWGRGAIHFFRTRHRSPEITEGPARWTYDRFPGAAPTGYTRASDDDRINVYYAGFQLLHSVHLVGGGWDSYSELMLPLWSFLPAAIPPILWWRRFRRGKARGFPIEAASPAPAS